MAKKTVKKKPSARVTINKAEKVMGQAAMMMNSAASMRASILRKLMGETRNIDGECGYPSDITDNDYKLMYARNGIAGRIVRILPEESWSENPLIYESEKPQDTEFERAWKALVKERHIYHYLSRIDILSGIGRYGILLLGIDDGLELNLPVIGINETTGEIV